MAKHKKTLADRITEFFNGAQAAWDAIPGYVKVFLYSSVSSIFGLWVQGELDWVTVVIIVAANIGIYSGPRAVSGGVRRLL